MEHFDNMSVEFTAHARCDRCGSRAYAQASKEGFTDLLWCIHHIKEFRDGLLDNNWDIFFDTNAIEDDLGVGALV